MKSLLQFLFGTLRGRLILGVALVHAVMMALFIVDLTARQRAMLLDRQSEQAAALSSALATTAAGWIAADDVAGLQELIEAQRRYPEFLFALLTDHDGYVLAASDPASRGKYLLDLPDFEAQTVLSRTAALVDVTTPAVIGGQHVGWARVGIGQSAAGAKLATIIRDGRLYILAAIVIGSLLAWLMGERITRRLYAVQETINKVRSGDRLARSSLVGNDEAAILSREFNAMLDAVAQRDVELQISAARLAEAQRIARIGNWEWDIPTNRLWWSDETYRLFNFPPGEFGADLAAFLHAIHPEDRERVQSSIDEALQKGSREWQIDYRITLADGTLRYVHEEAETRFASDGQPLKRIGTVQDVTESKEAEETLCRLNNELEERVKERTAELEAKNSELERINRIFVDRELRMVELKEQIKEMERRSASGEESAEGQGS